MTVLGDAARELAERDFRVLPLRPRTKKPMISNWGANASSSAERVFSWWRKWPDANVGVLAGNGLLMMDIDSREADEWAIAKGLPETPTVKTSRGRHLWFSGEAKGSKGKIFPGIDLQGAGTCVVAPPSIHPDTGAIYEWITDPDHPLAAVPDWALTGTATRVIGPVDGRFVEGERHDRLYKLASAMRGIGMGGEIESALRAANELRCVPVLTVEEIEDEVEKIMPTVLAHPPGWKPDSEITDVAILTGNSTAAVVYAAVRHACGCGDRCEVSVARLMDKTGIKSNKTIVKAIKDLRNARLIEVTKRQIRGIDQCNRYRLLFPKDQG